MIKDRWIYQRREDVQTPWALYVIKEFTPQSTFDDLILDVTIYSEQIGNSDHMASFINWHYDSITGYVGRIANEITAFGGEFNFDDFQYVERELCRFIF